MNSRISSKLSLLLHLTLPYVATSYSLNQLRLYYYMSICVRYVPYAYSMKYASGTQQCHLYFVTPSVYYVRKLLVLPQFVWLCGRDTDSSTSIVGVFNPGYGEYTIYDSTSVALKIFPKPRQLLTFLYSVGCGSRL